jgi:hypothetical protein
MDVCARFHLIRCARMHVATIWARSPVPSLRPIRDRWLFTVRADRLSSSPTERFVWPLATSCTTSTSRSDRSKLPEWNSRAGGLPGTVSDAFVFTTKLRTRKARAILIVLLSRLGVTRTSRNQPCRRSSRMVWTIAESCGAASTRQTPHAVAERPWATASSGPAASRTRPMPTLRRCPNHDRRRSRCGETRRALSRGTPGRCRGIVADRVDAFTVPSPARSVPTSARNLACSGHLSQWRRVFATGLALQSKSRISSPDTGRIAPATSTLTHWSVCCPFFSELKRTCQIRVDFESRIAHSRFETPLAGDAGHTFRNRGESRHFG